MIAGIATKHLLSLAHTVNNEHVVFLMNSDGKLLGAYDKQYFWDMTTNQPVTSRVMADAFSPDGRFIASIYNGDISLWGVPKK